MSPIIKKIVKKLIFCPLYFGCSSFYPDPFSPSRCGSGRIRIHNTAFKRGGQWGRLYTYRIISLNKYPWLAMCSVSKQMSIQLFINKLRKNFEIFTQKANSTLEHKQAGRSVNTGSVLYVEGYKTTSPVQTQETDLLLLLHRKER